MITLTKNILIIIIAFILNLTLLAETVTCPTGLTYENSSNSCVFKIMPIGDSITEGAGAGSAYRCPLFNYIKGTLVTNIGAYRNTLKYNLVGDIYYNAIKATEFVGSQSTGITCGESGANSHEGYYGKTSGEVLGFIQGYGGEFPNMVLIHLGTNDLKKDYDVSTSTTIQNLKSMINLIHERQPAAIILLAKIIPHNNYDVLKKSVDDLNSAIASIKIDNTYIVDQFVGFTEEMLSPADMVHPNSTGSDVIARKWLGMIQDIMVSSIMNR
jgi:lysophospholipase L1-like esterase